MACDNGLPSIRTFRVILRTLCPLTLELKAESVVNFESIVGRVDGIAKVGILCS